MAELKVISADSHASEPDNIRDRMPAEFRDRAPHTEVIDGKRYWVAEGSVPRPMDSSIPLTEEAKRREFRGGEELTAGYGREAGLDIPIRLADLEEDGISAEVIYPQGIFRAFTSPDPVYQTAICSTYNDYYAEIFGEYTDKFVPVGLIPTSDVDAAVAEVQRVVKLGFRAALLPLGVHERPYSDPSFEPLWSTLEEAHVPVSFHVSTISKPETDDWHSIQSLNVTLFGAVSISIEPMETLCTIVGSGMLERHPGMPIAFVECDIGWLAWLFNRIDQMTDIGRQFGQAESETLPSEQIKRQVRFTFQDDEAGINNIGLTGDDCLMWGSDYPHDEGTFPHSQEAIERQFKDVPEEQKRKIVFENAARLYNFPMN